jgi:putative ABC transport system permease protein
MLRTIFALALFAYPAEFRRDYRSQLFLDLEDRTHEQGYALRLFFDVLVNGIFMRIENLWRDIAYAVRTLARAPLFTIVVAGTLAAAIAGNAIVFSALEAVLLRPLPYPHVDRLMLATGKMRSGAGAPGMMMSLPFSYVDALAGKSPLIEAIGAALPQESRARVDGQLVTLHRAFVTRSYLATLGITPYLGRFFSTAGDANSQAVISYEYWRGHYVSDPRVVGKLLHVDAKAYTVVGVAPPGILDPNYGAAAHEDLWQLMPRDKHKDYAAFPVIRTRAGVSIAALNGDLNRFWLAAHAHDRDTFTTLLRMDAIPVTEALFENTRALWILFGAVIAVLLIACANIANLVLVRATTRSGQFAVRAALGATRARIAAQTLTETFVLCALGCGAGVAIAAALAKPALALIPGNLPRLNTASIDGTVLFYVCAIGIAVTLVAGLLPALKAGSGNLVVRRASRTRTILVAAEVAATFALLVCSGLFLRSFLTMVSQPLGFDPSHTYVASFILPTAPDVSDPNAAPLSANTAMRVSQRIKAIPGVTSVALATQVPFDLRFQMMGQFSVDAPLRPGPMRPERMSSAAQVTPNFFALMRIPILRGRNFTAHDMTGPDVIVVNEAFVRQFFKGKPALGKRIYGGNGGAQIVGIAGDTRTSLSIPPNPIVYLPFKGTVPVFQVLIRTTRESPQLATAVDRIAQQAYPRIGNPPVNSLLDAVRESAANARASFVLLAALTVIALILALAGIYGVVAFSTERRYHEIGVRSALGATARDILRQIVGGAFVQTLIGIALGLIVAAAAANAIDSQLFKTPPLDPAAFAGAMLLLLACTALAAALPAWRAMRIDPARTLRYE